MQALALFRDLGNLREALNRLGELRRGPRPPRKARRHHARSLAIARDPSAHLDNGGVLAGVKAGGLAVVTVALIASLLAFDLFPGPAALLALLVGGAGWVAARRGREAGRRLLEIFAGMVLAAAVIAVLAFALH